METSLRADYDKRKERCAGVLYTVTLSPPNFLPPFNSHCCPSCFCRHSLPTLAFLEYGQNFRINSIAPQYPFGDLLARYVDGVACWTGSGSGRDSAILAGANRRGRNPSRRGLVRMS